MKHLFLLLTLLTTYSALAQYPGNANDWIDLSKEHYKFKVEEDGIYRIQKAQLLAAGMAENEIVGAELQLFHNGEEVPVYVSTNGAFSDGDYLEFLGRKNDGKSDTPLYEDAEWQGTLQKSLFEEAGTYFLVHANATSKITNGDNDLTNLPAKEEYFMHESFINIPRPTKGDAYYISNTPIFDSEFKLGEGYGSYLQYLRINVLTRRRVATAGVDAKLKLKVAPYIFRYSGASDNYTVKVGNQTFTGQIRRDYKFNDLEFSIPATELGPSSTRVEFTETYSGRYMYYNCSIDYPRSFAFNNVHKFDIHLNGSGRKYVELRNIPKVDDNVIVYETTSNSRYSLPHDSTLKISTPSEGQNKLFYDNEVNTITVFEKVAFENLLEKKDILLIYNSLFDTELNGQNLLDKYAEHKASDIGGNLSTLKVNIDQITNQFAYGIHNHSSGIKNYIQELKEAGKLPEYVFIVGKGLQYFDVLKNSDLDEKNLVPTYGHPGSDNLLVCDYFSEQLLCSIGRVSVNTPEQLDAYINKVIQYETAQNDTSDSAQTKLKSWMKEGIHLGGGFNAYQQNLFRAYLESYESSFENPKFGGEITSVYKQSTDPVETVESVVVDSLINNGVSLITFFGHAAPGTLEFNLREASAYENIGKYPFILTNGCYVGDIFSSAPTLSESFVLEPNKGSIVFMGPSLYGISSGMNNFSTFFYKNLSLDEYSESAGLQTRLALNQNRSRSAITKLTKQQMIYHGDPTISINPHKKPDYIITEEDIRFNPERITAESETFEVIVDLMNIGKAQNEEVEIKLTRTLPDGTQEEFIKIVENLYYKKQVTFILETKAAEGEGINKFQVEIDPDDKLDEITRVNNNLSTPIQRQISTSNVTPVVPFEFAITNDRNLKLYASTINVSNQRMNFTMEIDTTEYFNSPLKKSTSISSNGGTISWQPNMNYQENKVYYWRAKIDEDNAVWENSSFIFLSQYETGWNQSHYFQFKKNEFTNTFVQESQDELFEFGENLKALTVRTGVVPNTAITNIAYYVDGYRYARYRYCGEVSVAVFDENTGQPWTNRLVSGGGRNGIGLYESMYCSSRIENVFNYDLDTEEGRRKFIGLIDAVPEGNHVLVYSHEPLNPNTTNWAGDAVTINDKLTEQGATQVNSIGEDAPYVFFFKKGYPDFEHKYEEVGADANTLIDVNLNLPTKWSRGFMVTKPIGPALSWDKFEWTYDHRYDNDSNGDLIDYDIIGITPDGTETVLFENRTDPSLDISSIDANQYPQIKLRLYQQDGENQTPAQMQYWRVIFEQAGELAININGAAESFPIKKERGQSTDFTYKIDNIGSRDFTEVLVKYILTDANGGVRQFEQRYAALPKGESLTVSVPLDVLNTTNVGMNSLLIDVNPNEDQKELYHFNNTAFVQYEVTGDESNPYLDVTFDGIHIIDGDLVSDTPNILVTLTDENKYLFLDDPDAFEIVLTDPNGNETIYTSDSPEITFYPAEGDENRAKVEFKPNLAPGTYTMVVRAKDRSDNASGANDYRVTFEVTDEDIITRVVNYPNPFTTNTQFIANIIGEVPDQILIQVFAPDGKVVKEIQTLPSQVTVSDGNNFYKLADWDGTDEYGDPLGNGVYFYKVTLKRNGQIVEPKENDTLSKYFHNGIGKLYILR